MSQKNYRLPTEITATVAAVAKEHNLPEAELVRRALRYYIRKVKADPAVLIAKESSEELPAPPA